MTDTPPNHHQPESHHPRPVVAKFGGSSVADADQVRKIAAIVRADPRRRFVVVSAPGKRNDKDKKITDLLYLCHSLGEQGLDAAAPFAIVKERYLGHRVGAWRQRGLGVAAGHGAADRGGGGEGLGGLARRVPVRPHHRGLSGGGVRGRRRRHTFRGGRALPRGRKLRPARRAPGRRAGGEGRGHPRLLRAGPSGGRSSASRAAGRT